MTEYDYSPEGYARYLATQNRVSNWVTDQASRAQQYSTPFGARSVSTPPSDYYQRPSSGRRRSSSRHSSSSYQAEPRPAYSRDAYRSSHSTHLPPQAGYTVAPPPPHAPAPPQGYGAAYKTYDPSSREVVLPAPRRGETYVIIPPKGRRIEIVVSLSLSSFVSPLAMSLTFFVSFRPTVQRVSGRLPKAAPAAPPKRANLCSSVFSQTWGPHLRETAGTTVAGPATGIEHDPTDPVTRAYCLGDAVSPLRPAHSVL